MQKLYYIYKITNLINRKIYIGKSVNPNKRFINHKYYALKRGENKNQCQKLYRSIRKYGIENFSLTIIESFIDENESYSAEIKYIKDYDTIANGLNLTPGGKGGWATGKNHSMWGRKHRPESRKKMSESHLGRIPSEETLEKQRLSKSGNKSHFAKLSAQDVNYIKQELNLGRKVKELAAQFLVSLVTIYNIRSGESWK